MNCLEFMRLRQERGELDENIDLSDENIVEASMLPAHRDLWTLIYHQRCDGRDIVGNVTSGNAVIGWIEGDGKVHTSITDNHFLEGDDSGESEG